MSAQEAAPWLAAMGTSAQEAAARLGAAMPHTPIEEFQMKMAGMQKEYPHADLRLVADAVIAIQSAEAVFMPELPAFHHEFVCNDGLQFNLHATAMIEPDRVQFFCVIPAQDAEQICVKYTTEMDVADERLVDGRLGAGGA